MSFSVYLDNCIGFQNIGPNYQHKIIYKFFKVLLIHRKRTLVVTYFMRLHFRTTSTRKRQGSGTCRTSLNDSNASSPLSQFHDKDNLVNFVQSIRFKNEDCQFMLNWFLKLLFNQISQEDGISTNKYIHFFNIKEQENSISIPNQEKA